MMVYGTAIGKDIQRGLFLNLLGLLLLLLLALAGCGGGGGSDGPSETRCQLGGLFIDEPTHKDYYTSKYDSMLLSGPSDSGSTVTWHNETSGNSGTAISGEVCRTSLLGTICRHEWWTSDVGLVKGDNHIEVSAHAGGELVGRDCITAAYVPYEPAILPLWVKQFGTAEDEVGQGIAVDVNYNSYISGYMKEKSNPAATYGFIAKHDTFGNQLWTINRIAAGFGIDIDENGNSYTSGYSINKYDASGNHLWEKNDFMVGYGIDVDANGTSYIAGSTNQDQGGGDYYIYPWESDVIIAKYDNSGNSLWIRQFGTSSPEVGRGVAVDGNGNSYITGYTEGNLAGTGNDESYDAFLAKYDTSGNQLWIKQYGTSSYNEAVRMSYLNKDIAYGVAVDANGNSYITGYTEKEIAWSTSKQYDVFIAKYDTSGNQLWVKELSTSGDYDEIGYGIAVDANGNSYITGYTEGNLAGTGNAGGVGYDVFIAKVDTDGNQVWIRQYGTPSDDKGYGIAVDANGNSYITGSTYSDLAGSGHAGGYDVFTMALPP